MSDLYNRLRETTTSDAIAYSPTSLFMGHHSDIIPFPGLTTEWDSQKKLRNRRKKMREAIDQKVVDLQIQISDNIKQRITSSQLTYKRYIQLFKYTRDLTSQTTMINIANPDKSIQNFQNSLGDDVGELELILTTLEGSKPINKFEIFSQFDSMLGCRLQSVPVKTVMFIYDGFMGNDYVERETITVSDPDVLSSLQQTGIKNKIAMGNKMSKVYPIDRFFDEGFYSALYKVVHSDFDIAEPEDVQDDSTEDEKGVINGDIETTA